MSPALAVVSFGYGHRDDPAADLVLDVRHRIRDPHVSPELRQLTGLDPEVFGRVANHPGAADLVADTFQASAALARHGLAPVTVAFGCVGGRHRSVVLAELLGRRARDAGWRVAVRHRHIDLPVLNRREDP